MEHLKFETLESIDHGSIALAMNQALKAAFTDCADRPELKTARKITLEIQLKPIQHGGDFAYADVGFQIKTTAPAKGIVVPMKVTREGLAFQPDAPDNPDQNTIAFDRDDEEDE